MVYSDVTNNDWYLILTRKEKYTKSDLNKIIKTLPQLTWKQAKFVVYCTAAFHDTSISKSLY